jgi:threonine/homoserine efflux transporter RhtA
MTAWIRIGLLLIALVTFAAGGAALGVVRMRRLHDGRTDWSMLSVAGALTSVGALCTAAATGFLGILAFGGVTVWASYILAAQRIGLFRVQSTTFEEPSLEEPRHRA